MVATTNMTDKRSHRPGQCRSVVVAYCAVLLGALAARNVYGVEQTLRPVAGGTIIDGGPYGPFDGVGDIADWSFNESSFEGAVTLVRQPPPPFEGRVVFEFNLASAAMTAPLTAHLIITIRGAARFPAENATVEVYAYEADLIESIGDFAAPPLYLLDARTIAPLQPATEYVLEVSDPVNALFDAGEPRIGIRLQIAPQSPTDSLQVFLDILDSDPETQPALMLIDRTPGDANGDEVVDLSDATHLVDCLNGPAGSMRPPCDVVDFDLDRDVDLMDYARFERALSRYGSP